jgi:hypothetical protein
MRGRVVNDQDPLFASRSDAARPVGRWMHGDRWGGESAATTWTIL